MKQNKKKDKNKSMSLSDRLGLSLFLTALFGPLGLSVYTAHTEFNESFLEVIWNGAFFDKYGWVGVFGMVDAIVITAILVVLLLILIILGSEVIGDWWTEVCIKKYWVKFIQFIDSLDS